MVKLAVLLALVTPFHAQHHKPKPKYHRAVASWYNDAGSTASGWHARYGVANKYLKFGTRIKFLYRHRKVTAIVDDRGPYVAGRTWDLNQNTAHALGFDGVQTVSYQIVRR